MTHINFAMWSYAIAKTKDKQSNRYRICDVCEDAVGDLP